MKVGTGGFNTIPRHEVRIGQFITTFIKINPALPAN
jgi:hypothetical protein